LTALELHVSQNLYICGETFIAADVYVGSHIAWGLMFGTIDKRPTFVDYVARLQSWPAAKRANQLDDATQPASS
jgi:glutathione S-transferase